MSLIELSEVLSKDLSVLNVTAPKTVVFCQLFVDCYQLFGKIHLLEKFTYPAGYPELHQFHLVEMYHGGCMTYVREAIVKTFTEVRCTLRLVIATSGFGMGIDCPDIRRIIHWGIRRKKLDVLVETIILLK